MKVTLCGSTRFMDRYHAANRHLTLQGHLVYSVAVPSTAYTNHPVGATTPAEKLFLDCVHLNKILESDAIVVIGWRNQDDDYIGESTRREVIWAGMHGKVIYSEAAAVDMNIVGVVGPGSPETRHIYHGQRLLDEFDLRCAERREARAAGTKK